MKLNIYLKLGWILFGMTVCSCYDDQGNYNYREITEIGIDSLNDVKGFNKIYLKDTIRIEPEINVSIATDEATLEYKWIANYVTDEMQKQYAIGNERNLNYFVELPKGNYRLSLSVKDLNSGVVWTSPTANLQVNSLLSSGWMLLGERNDRTVTLDFLSTSGGDTLLLKDVLRGSKLPLLQGARQIFAGYYWRNFEPAILTDDGAYYLENDELYSDLSYNLKNYVMDQIVGVGDSFAPVAMEQGYKPNNRHMVAGDYGYSTIIDADAPFTYFSNVTSRYDGSAVPFKVAPYIALDITSSSADVMFYNTDELCFVVKDGEAYCRKLTDYEVGMELRYLFNSQDKRSYALFRNGSGEFHLYSFQVAWNPKNLITKKLINATDMEQMRSFIVSTNRSSVIIYNTDHKIYGYDLNKMTCEELKSFPEEISCMKFHTRNSASNSPDEFFLCLHNGNENGGELRKYEIVYNVNKVEIKEKEEKYTGLCKIKDINFKNQ